MRPWYARFVNRESMELSLDYQHECLWRHTQRKSLNTSTL